MDVWIDNVVKLYRELGRKRTIQVLNKIEKDGRLAELEEDRANIQYVCPVCGKRSYDELRPYCPECGAHLIFDKSESIFACMDDWKKAYVRPADEKVTYLVCNIFGDKYLAGYDSRLHGFCAETKKDMNLVLAYTPVKDEDTAKILKLFCTRRKCSTCGHLQKENGVYRCPYEDVCGAHRFSDYLPKYKLPYYVIKNEVQA